MSKLNPEGNEIKRIEALKKRCCEYKDNLRSKNLQTVAQNAAMGLQKDNNNQLILCGEYFSDKHHITWPQLSITDSKGKQATLQVEAVWLHYLDKADGKPVTGRWVNLSEIGALFYQQAFQGYSGDMLAEAWKDDIEGLKKVCVSKGGWPLGKISDLAFEWRALPRLPICLCYRKQINGGNAWATILFDASAKYYVAADVAAIIGKKLADSLMP